MPETEAEIKELTVKFKLLELLAKQNELRLIEADLKAAEYLENLD